MHGEIKLLALCRHGVPLSFRLAARLPALLPPSLASVNHYLSMPGHDMT